MPMYRVKTEPFESRCLSTETAHDLEHWCGGVLVEEIDVIRPGQIYVGIDVPTAHGVERAREGDYIIKHYDGTFSTSRPEIFKARYEPVLSV